MDTKVLGGLYAGEEYLQAMEDAKAEFAAWEAGKRQDRKMTREKYRAQRLAKLHMQDMFPAGA